MQTAVNSDDLKHSLNLNISHSSIISDTIIRHWVRNDTRLPHWCIFGSETLHVPATLFDSLGMAHRFISLCGKRASHSPARTPSKTLSFAKVLVSLLRVSGILYKGKKLGMDHTAAQCLNCCLKASWGCELNAWGLTVWDALPVSVFSGFLAQPNSMRWTGQRRVFDVLSVALLWGVVQLCSMMARTGCCSPTASLICRTSSNRKVMTDCMNVMNSRRMQTRIPLRGMMRASLKKHSRRI